MTEVALVHGHLCDGLVVAWVELGVALRQLFPEGAVDRTDVRVVSKNGPCWVDAAAWTTGARVNHGTLALDNAVGNGFIVQRMSNGRAVRVQLRDGVFPQELTHVEASIRGRRAAGGSVTVDEIERFERLAAKFGDSLLSAPPESVIESVELRGFVFPTRSADPIVPRSDIINRDLDAGP